MMIIILMAHHNFIHSWGTWLEIDVTDPNRGLGSPNVTGPPSQLHSECYIVIVIIIIIIIIIILVCFMPLLQQNLPENVCCYYY